MKRIHLLLIALLIALIVVPATAAQRSKKKKAPATIDHTVESTNGPIPAPDIPRQKKQAADVGPPVVAKPSPEPHGNPHEDKLTKAPGSGRKFDLRNLPRIPPVARDRNELEPPEPAPVLIGPPVPESVGAKSVPPFRPVPAAPAPPPNAVYEGLDRFNWGAGSPPDTNGDVGPNDYIETVNTSIGVFRKSDGFMEAAFTFNTFMSQGNFGNLCDTNNFGDPVVLYDTFEDRWIITDFAFLTDVSGNVLAPAYQCFAASMGGNPLTSGWNFYSIQIADNLNDYPKFGIWPDGLYMSANLFSFGAGSAFKGARVWALNKAQMYAGSPTVKVVSFDVGGGDFTVIPSNARLQTGTPPAGRPNLFVSTWQFLNALTVYKFHVDWTDLSLSTFTGPDVPLAATSWPNAGVANVPQSGTSQLLDALQIRAMVQNQYTNFGGTESLWVPHTVRRQNTSGFAAPRWYQVDVSGGTVGANLPQATTWDPDGANVMHRWMPSLALDRAGDLALGYSTSSSTTFPSIKYAGRLAGDPINTFSQTEQTFFTGTASQLSSTRWGDYSSMTLDPDGCTFWYANEYATGLDDLTIDPSSYNKRWKTKFGSFGPFPGCTPVGAGGTVSGTVTRVSDSTPIAGATVALGARSATTDGSGVYQFLNIPAGTYPTISASFPGYVSSSASSIAVTDGGTTTQNFALAAAPASACLTDTTQADFLAGVPTSVDLNISPGDVTLSNAPVIDQQNTAGTSTGTGFGTPNWTGQTFIAAVTGQLVKADVQLFCNGCGATPPNLTLSVRATSGGLPTGADLASTTIPGSTFASGASVTYTATFGSPATLTSGTQYALVLRPVSAPAGSGYFWIRSSPSTYANGSRVLSADGGTSWSADTTRDFNFKTYMQTGYAASGNLVSSPKDANPATGITPIWSTLSWNATVPANTSLKFQVAASNNGGGPFNFVGPDGTAGTFFTTSPASLAQFYNFRYLEYKAILGTTDSTQTPTLNDVTLCFNDVDCSAVPPITPAPAQVCSSTTGNTAAGPAGATSYAWSITNGTITGGSTSQTVTYTAGASGNVGLLLNIVLPNGCHQSNSINVTINPIPPTPTINAGGPTTFCAGGSVVLTSSAASGNQWNLNNSPIGGATGTTYTAAAAGGYTVTATVNGCSATSGSTTVTVFPLPPTPTITPGGPTTFCAGGSVVLTSSAASGNQWKLNGNPIGGATSQSYVASASGSYTVTVTDGNSCTATSAPTSVTVNPLPATPTIGAGGPTTFCAGGSVTLTSSSVTGNQWKLNGNPIGGATSQSYVASASGSYTVTVTDGNNCTATSAPTAVTVNPNPNATITAAGSMTAGTAGTASVANAGAGATYNWSVGNGAINSGQGTNSLNFTAGSAGTLTLGVTVTTSANCSDTKSANVTVISAVTVTSVTPPAGSTFGGQPVTINGSGFVAGAAVTFGGSAATNVVVVSSVKITAKTPAHAGGAVNVVVTNTDTGTGTLTNGYTYNPQKFDPNNDGVVDAADIFYLINYLFLGGPAPQGPGGMLSGDANGDLVVDPADIFYLVRFIFDGGPMPATPQGDSRLAASSASGKLSGSIALGDPVRRGDKTFVPVIVSIPRGADVPEALSLRLRTSDGASAVAIRRAGAASDVRPTFEHSERTANGGIAYLVSYGRGIVLTETGGVRSAVVAEVEVTGEGQLDPALTMLSNAGGTRTATAGNGQLTVSGTRVGAPRAPRHE